jgi:hypothetical protein
MMSVCDSDQKEQVVAAQPSVDIVTPTATSAADAAAVFVMASGEKVEAKVVSCLKRGEELWGTLLRRRAAELEKKKSQVLEQLEVLMQTATEQEIISGQKVFKVTDVGMPKKATFKDGCEWRNLAKSWAEQQNLKASFHTDQACWCTAEKRSRCDCRTPTITLSWK